MSPTTLPGSPRVSALDLRAPASADADPTYRARQFLNNDVWDLDHVVMTAPRLRAELDQIRSKRQHDAPLQVAFFKTALGACRQGLDQLDSFARKGKTIADQLATTERTANVHARLRDMNVRLAQIDAAEQYCRALHAMMTLQAAPLSMASWQKLSQLRVQVDQLPPSSIQGVVHAACDAMSAELVARLRETLVAKLTDIGWPGKPIENGTTTAAVQTVLATFSDMYLISPTDAVAGIMSLVAPRFQYHFSGPRPTNQLQHPDWYLGYLRHFLSTHQAFYVRLAAGNDAALEALVSAVTHLAEAKLTHDVPTLAAHHPALLCRTLTQVAQFAADMRARYGFPAQGLALATDVQETVVASVAEYVVASVLEVRAAADAAQLVHEEDVDVDEQKRTRFGHRIEQYLALVEAVPVHLNAQFARKFIDRVIVKALYVTADELDEWFEIEHDFAVQVRVASTMAHLASHAQTLIHSLEDPSKSLTEAASRLDSKFRTALDTLAATLAAHLDRAVTSALRASSPVPGGLGSATSSTSAPISIATALSSPLHAAQINSPAPVYRRLFLKLERRIDLLATNAIARANAPRAAIHAAIRAVHAAVAAAAPPAVRVDDLLPAWTQVDRLVAVSPEAARRLLAAVREAARPEKYGLSAWFTKSEAREVTQEGYMAAAAASAWRESAVELRVADLPAKEVVQVLAQLVRLDEGAAADSGGVEDGDVVSP
ncbi:RAD50-interacting protein 1 [Allomyces arbusculus]|nr:RAD50-interacting protein 1 [Allomyces arbusculus]